MSTGDGTSGAELLPGVYTTGVVTLSNVCSSFVGSLNVSLPGVTLGFGVVDTFTLTLVDELNMLRPNAK